MSLAVIEEERGPAVEEIGPSPAGIRIAGKQVECKPPLAQLVHGGKVLDDVLSPLLAAVLLLHVEHATRDREFGRADSVETLCECTERIVGVQRNRVRNHRLGDVEPGVATVETVLPKIC